MQRFLAGANPCSFAFKLDRPEFFRRDLPIPCPIDSLVDSRSLSLANRPVAVRALFRKELKRIIPARRRKHVLFLEDWIVDGPSSRRFFDQTGSRGTAGQHNHQNYSGEQVRQ